MESNNRISLDEGFSGRYKRETTGTESEITGTLVLDPLFDLFEGQKEVGLDMFVNGDIYVDSIIATVGEYIDGYSSVYLKFGDNVSNEFLGNTNQTTILYTSSGEKIYGKIDLDKEGNFIFVIDNDCDIHNKFNHRNLSRTSLINNVDNISENEDVLYNGKNMVINKKGDIFTKVLIDNICDKAYVADINDKGLSFIISDEEVCDDYVMGNGSFDFLHFSDKLIQKGDRININVSFPLGNMDLIIEIKNVSVNSSKGNDFIRIGGEFLTLDNQKEELLKENLGYIRSLILSLFKNNKL